MHCGKCENPFDEHTFIPRLLIVCGHSFCESCLHKCHVGGKILCPECHATNFVECIDSLPRNLALLGSRGKEGAGIQCQKHNKRFEAFCEKEKSLLCINCILEDVHRNHHHMIEPIATAFQKEKDKMGKHMTLTQKIYTKIQDQLNRLEEAYLLGLKSFQDNQLSIEKHFHEVKKLVQLQEDNIKQKSKDLFLNFEAKNKERESMFVNSLEVLDDYVNEVSKAGVMSVEQFLERTKVRESLMLKFDGEIDGVVTFAGLTVNKNTVLDCLVKVFERAKSKELKESNAKEPIKVEYSKPKGFGDKLKKPCGIKQNPSSKIVPKKYCKRQIKEPTREAIRDAIKESVPSKRPTTAMQKPIPSQISGFQQNHTLYKSFFSSNASFFIERRYIYVFGGFCQESNCVVRFNLDTLKWDPIAPMMNRSKFGVVQLNKEIVVLGGKREKLRIAGGEVFKDNRMGSCWGLDNVRSGFGMVVLNDHIHVVGGNDGEEILNTFERFSQTEMVWKRMEPLIEGRDELAVTVGRDNKIYAIGGFGGTEGTCLRSVERYDPATQRWEFTKPMLLPRRALSAVTLADGIYAIGGFDGQNYLSSVQKYDQYTNTWTLVSNMKEARCTHSAVAIFQTQEILVFGGFDFSPLASVEKYSVVTDKWEVLSEMPAPRFMHGCLYVKE